MGRGLKIPTERRNAPKGGGRKSPRRNEMIPREGRNDPHVGTKCFLRRGEIKLRKNEMKLRKNDFAPTWKSFIFHVAV